MSRSIAALILLVLVTYASAQSCPVAPVSSCPYDLTVTPGVVTTSSNVNAPGRLQTVTTPTQLDMQFSPTLPGKYTFQFEAMDLCMYTNRSVVVEARCPPAPTVVATPSSTQVPQGQGVTIVKDGSAPATNFAVTLTYTWKVVSAPVNTGLWVPGSTFPAGNVASVSKMLTIDGTDLVVAGQYVVSLTATDGCSVQTVYTCFQVVCNCGPTASAGATPTIWSNVDTNTLASTRGDNRAQGVQFKLKGGNSYDFDLLYNPTTERLTYSWDFVSWTPAGNMAWPNQVEPSPSIPTTKQPQTWLSSGSDVAATAFAVGYRTLYTPPTTGSSVIEKTWAFQQVPPLVASNWQNTTVPGATTVTPGTGTGVDEWRPLYNNNYNAAGVTGGQEWFQTYELPATPSGTPDDPTVTSFAARVVSTVATSTVTVPYTVTNTLLTPVAQSTITYCQIKITQSPNPGAGAPSPNLAQNYWEATLQIQGQFQWPLTTGGTRPFSFEQCRGLWVFRLTVQDGCGSTTASTDDFRLTVRCNRPPVSVVACNNTVLWQTSSNKFDQVTVDGRSSNDADNFVLTYYWQFVGALNPTYTAACTHGPCVQTYCNDPTLYTGYTYPNRPQTSPAPGTAGKSWGNGNNNGFTKGTQSGSCCSNNECGPTVYPMFYRPSTPPATGSTCRPWSTPPANIAPPSPASQQDCPYPAISPTGFHVGNSAYFTPNSPGTYRVQLTVYDGCSSVLSQVSVVAKCPIMTLSISLASTQGTFTIVSSNNPVVQTTVTLDYPEGSYSALSYTWAVTNQASGYTFSSTTAFTPTFRPTSPNSYQIQLTVTDGCQNMIAQAPMYRLACPSPATQPIIMAYQGTSATGTALCQASGASSVCNAQLSLEASGNQYAEYTLSASATQSNNDPLTYNWVLDSSTPYVPSSTFNPTNTRQAITFRPTFSGGLINSGFSIRYTVTANDGCSNSPPTTIQMQFTCTNTLTAQPQATTLAVNYDINGSTGTFPSATFYATSSTVPYPSATGWAWSIDYTNVNGAQITVGSGVTGALSGAAAPIGNITFTPTVATRYNVRLTLTDKCRTANQLLNLQANCLGNPTAIVTTTNQAISWDSFKNVFNGGFPLVTLKSASTPVSVSAPSTNTIPLISQWTAVTGNGQLATAGTLGGSSNSENPTFTPSAAGTYQFTLSVTNGACSSSGTATATVVTSCLSILASVAPLQSPISWDGVRFPTVELDGSASTYTTNTGAPANYNSLRYTWLFTESPSNSMFVKQGTTVSVGTNTQTPATLTYSTTTNTVPGTGATNLTLSATYSMVQVTTTTTWTTTLFNHHYNRPMTCFKPDVTGTYTVQLTIDDGCSQALSRVKSVTVVVLCQPQIAVQIAASGGNIQVVLNGTRYQRVNLDARATTPNGWDTLTYTWTLTSIPSTITQSTPKVSTLGLGSAAIMNYQGNYASFVPDVAGVYGVQLAVSDGCNSVMTASVTVTVTCTTYVSVSTPAVLIDNVAFVATSTAPQPAINYPVTGSWTGTFTLQGIATTNCEVFTRSWRLLSRQCAGSFIPTLVTPPPTPAPVSSCPANTRTCVWTVDQWPCKASTDTNWVRPTECSGSGTAACTLTTTGSTCSAAFTPRYPGIYRLKLVVTDNCSSSTSYTNVTARCDLVATSIAGANKASYYQCSGSTWAFQAVTLNGEQSSLLPQFAPIETCASTTTTPAPTPAPPSSTQCCPQPLPCPDCPVCAACPPCTTTTSSTSTASSDSRLDITHRSFAALSEETEDLSETRSTKASMLLSVAVPVSLVTILSALINVVQFVSGLARSRANSSRQLL